MLLVSYLTRIKPSLTPQLINLLLPIIYVPEQEFQKTHDDLDYRPPKLEAILSDCVHWMQEEGMIKTKKLPLSELTSNPEVMSLKIN